MYSHDNSVHNYDQAYIVCLNIEHYHKLTYKCMSTVCSQVEAILNQRDLTCLLQLHSNVVHENILHVRQLLLYLLIV